jgi:pimeloyl-ACP methyl ester carboxylesterase
MSRYDHTFNAPDGDFHFIDWGGSGPLAHIAHATGLCAGVYTPLAQRLEARLKILGLDDRGHGKTKAPANPGTLKNWNTFITDLEQFLETLSGPVIAMGHSRGATVSLLLAIKRPDLIRALVLIDPTILPFSWMWGWFLAKKTGLVKWIPIAARAAKRKNGWPNRAAVMAAYKKKGVFRHWADGFLEAYVSEGTEETKNGIIKLCCEPAWESKCFAVCPHDVWRYIPQLKQPVCVLYGAESDTFLVPAVKRFEAVVPHAVFHRFDQTGHFVPMEQPQQTVEAIFSFLDSQDIS